MKPLITNTLTIFLTGAVVLGILLFMPAWTLNYWQAWVFIFVFQVCVNAIGVYLSIKDPALLERRKKVGPAAERSTVQQIIMSIALLGIISLLVFCSVTYRLRWFQVPAGVSIIGDGLVILGLYINFLVFKENSFGGATVQTFDAQQVISTGPYALVRHPMYAGVLVMMIGVPLALGSWGGLAFLVLLLPGLVWRILDEEKLLKKDLPGYADYTLKVRYRLVPYIW